MINSIIDLSDRFSPVRDQGLRPTCLAFAISDAHSFARDVPFQYLSPEYIFFFAAHRQALAGISYDHGIIPTNAWDALRENGHPLEEHYPYRGFGASDGLIAPPDPFPYPVYREQPVSHEALKEVVIGALESGNPAIIGIGLTEKFFEGIELIDDDGVAVVRGYHAIVAVGYGVSSFGSCCIKIRNSWGGAWGSAGYAWLSEEYIENRLQWVATIGAAI